MNKKYNLKLDLQFRCNNSIMKFNQFDNNTSDFFMRITNGGNLVDVEKAIVVLAAIKPSGKVASQFVEVKNGLVYADLKPSMKDEIGTYAAQAMLILEDERVVTDVISYEVEEDKIFSLLNDTVETSEEFTLLTDMLSRLSNIEISEEQRVINEAERILSEENRKIEEVKRVEAELIRQHEEADRAKYDATRESNENIRKINEEARISSENVRLENEANRIEQEANRVKAEQLRKDNYNFMTEDEERRRLEANAHKEAEVLRVQAETNRVNEEAKRRTTEQGRISAENTRVSNENTRKDNETTRQTNETKRVEAETQRQNRYNSFIADAEVNASNFENYTNTAKVKEEERKSNELDRKSQEVRRVSNEVERISNENTRKANEVAREKNETSRQYVFENKVDEVDKKIIEINATKDNFVSSVNTKVDSKISELDNTKSDMATSINNKVNEVENRFNALTSKQQQDAEVIDARDGETSLKARLDRDIEKAKQVYANVEGSYISTDSSVGYAKDVEILGNTIQSASNLADIRSVGDKVEGQELYEIPVVSDNGGSIQQIKGYSNYSDGYYSKTRADKLNGFTILENAPMGQYTLRFTMKKDYVGTQVCKIYEAKNNEIINEINLNILVPGGAFEGEFESTFTTSNEGSVLILGLNTSNALSFSLKDDVNLSLGEKINESEEDKLTILSPVQLEKVGDVRDRIICKDGVWGVEKNIVKDRVSASNIIGGVGLNDKTFDVAFKLSEKSLLHQFNGISINDFSDKYSYTRSDDEHYYIENDLLIIFMDKNNVAQEVNIENVEKYFNINPINILYIATPQFIPLPHSQQIKLRTFASKTNISFLTEIEGTIKAQVPKSLGATVNTHTEQIRSLNNELNRVKKLEESTVSTVETESDFTTVEATNGGYFEDVKLEGKTLVNLLPKIKFTQAYGGNKHISDYPFNFKNANLVSNKLYTICIYGDISILQGQVIVTNVDGKDMVINLNSNGTALFKFVSELGGSPISKLHIYGKNNTTELTETYLNSLSVSLLEGDHTQNPPSFFEGLKSVGDGADEIVVSSVKGDGNLFDGELFSGWVSNGVVNQVKLGSSDNIITNYIKVKPNQDYANNFNFNYVWIFDRNRNFIKLINKNSPINVENGEYAIFGRSIGHTEIPNLDMSNIQIIKGIKISEYTPHQSDKKRLLYYNEETQAWEKPILREGDSIEKHANGKYYYHQRSGAKVLNGSENWNNDKNSSTMSPATYRQSIQFDAIDIPSASFDTKTSPNIISDLLPTVVFGDVYSYNRIGISISGTDSIATHIIINNNFTDVTELKQWLQANNLTVVYQLAEEKVYECTNIDLITYNGETNYIVESGVLSPKTTLKVHSNISNVVSLLQKKVSLLESNMTKYMITQNRLMLASRYNADTVSFKVDVASFSDTFEYDNDLYELILNNILVGKDNYNREYIENLIRFYWMDFIISDEMYSTLFEIIKEQHNPKIEEEEETPLI